MPHHAYQQRPTHHPAALTSALAQAERDAETVARHDAAAISSSLAVTPADSAELLALTPDTAGATLDPTTRRQMGTRFGHDFGRVRVHSDAAAADLAAGAHARAYTVGHDLVFGRGQYAPGTPTGQALLAHELSHVVQQASAGVRAVQRDDADKPAPVPPADPETVLGQRLAKDFSNGIAVAFYAPMPANKEAAQVAAELWAQREQALGIRGKAVTAKNAVFGAAMSDDAHPLVATIQAIGTMLTASVAKAPPNPAGPLPPGTGPATIRTLAVFAHGTTDWCGLGSITSSRAASIIKSIAPTLASNVNVVLFSCNSGRSPDESEEWVRNTMRPGGEKSLAGVTRDALVAEGKTGTVWGHGATGHVTDNFVLREFDTLDGKGAEGASFVQRYVFGGAEQAIIAAELLDGVVDGGYQPVNDTRLRNAANAQAEQELYRGFAAANGALKYGGDKLAASIPTHPVEIGKQVKEYWDQTHWPARKATAVEKFVKAMLASAVIKKQPLNAVP